MSTHSDLNEVDPTDAPDISDAEFEEANRRGEEMRKHVPWALSAKYEPAVQRILAPLSSGIELSLPVESYEFLLSATEEQRSKIQVCAAGYELFFPDLDEGVWLPNYLLRHAETSRWLLDHPEAA